MRLTVMQPYLLPYLGYWQLMEAADIFVFYDDVQYLRRSYMTRNQILLQGKPFTFTLPTVKADQKSLITEIIIDTEEYDKWSEKILNTIYHAYSKAPYFEKAYPVIERIFDHYHPNLSEFLKFSIQCILKYLNIQVELASSSQIHYIRSGTAEEKIISICEYFDADAYINPIGGKDLYQHSSFRRHSIELLFLQPEIRPYPQFQLSFESHLSIIDMMMFISREEIAERLRDFQLLKNEPIQ